MIIGRRSPPNNCLTSPGCHGNGQATPPPVNQKMTLKSIYSTPVVQNIFFEIEQQHRYQDRSN